LNVPRVTYQNGGGGCPSLLLEKQSTNTSSYSEASSTFNAAIVTNAANLLGMKAYIVAADYSLGDAPNVACADFVANTTYTYSIYVDFNSLTGTELAMTMLAFFPGVEYAGMIVNKATKAITTVNNGSIWTINSATIEHQKDEIYRVICSATPNTNGGAARTYVNSGNFQSVNVAGIQVEASSYATSYIQKTSSASATRVADLLNTVTLSNVGITNNFTMFFDWSNFKNDISGFVVTCLDSSYGLVWCVYGGTVIIPTSTGTEYPTGLAPRSKFACKYNGTNVTYFQNGVKYGPFTAATNYSDATYLAPNGDQISQIYKNEMVLFNSALTDAECIALTTI
jgi:hypothetical protein